MKLLKITETSFEGEKEPTVNILVNHKHDIDIFSKVKDYLNQELFQGEFTPIKTMQDITNCLEKGCSFNDAIYNYGSTYHIEIVDFDVIL